MLENAPILVVPDASRPPLRVAAAGTSLVLVKDEGEWLQVEFQDPQWGVRTGYIQRKFVRVETAALRPLDLSVPGRTVPPARSAPESQAAQGGDTRPASPPPVSVAEDRGRQLRSGFWFNAGMGVGSLGCDTCINRRNGPSGGLSLGGTVGDKWLLGGGTTGWARDTPRGVLTVGTLDFRVRFYPALRSGFFITGGVGLGGISLDTDSEFGAGAMLGIGWDIRVGRNVSLTPFYNGFAMRSTFDDANVGQVGIGVTIH